MRSHLLRRLQRLEQSVRPKITQLPEEALEILRLLGVDAPDGRRTQFDEKIDGKGQGGV